jgi:hypothetical protein
LIPSRYTRLKLEFESPWGHSAERRFFVFRALSPNKPQVSFCAAESCGHKMAQALP